jgi:predicted PurR-regulated permease PerM
VDIRLTRHERVALRWTLLALPVIAVIVAVLLVGAVADRFSTILAIFFLAWLLAFLLDPVVTWVVSRVPRLPRGLTAALVFVVMVVLAMLLLVAVASSVLSSLRGVIGNAATMDDALRNLLAPLQEQIDAAGLDIDLQAAASDAVSRLQESATGLLGEIVNGGLVLFTQGTAIIFIAVVMVANKSRFLRFVRRLIPVDRTDLYEDFVAATTHSFGGFIRGQFGIAALYGVLVGAIAWLFGVPFVALIAVVTAALQSIPYFGQLVSWIPLVGAALLFTPDALVPVTLVLVITLLVVQNVVSPKVLASSVGLNPILVLAAVFIGAQLAGALGAVFGVPVAAVGATLFGAWLDRVRPEQPPVLGSVGEQVSGDAVAVAPAASAATRVAGDP